MDQILNAIPDKRPTDRRYVICLAGPPASGKSTMAENLAEALSPHAAILGMDAFHFDDAILEMRGHRKRKGAPHTFDVGGYARFLQILRDEPSLELALPRFDRPLELSRNCAELIGPEQTVLITEGNYLLLDEDPWRGLLPLFDLTVFLSPGDGVLKDRLRHRWMDHALPKDKIEAKLLENDLPNARLVLERSRRAEIDDRFS